MDTGTPAAKVSPHGCLERGILNGRNNPNATPSCHISVRIQPKASRNACTATSDGLVRLAVTAPPMNGEANKAATALLAKLLAVPKRAVRLVTGEKSRDKMFAIDGINLEAAMGRLREGS